MLTHHRRARIRLHQALDACLFGAALGVAYWLRARWPFWGLSGLEPFSDYLMLAPLVMLLGPAMLALQHFYESPALPPRRLEIGALVRGGVLTVLGVILILFLLRLQFARSVVIMTGVFASGLVYARVGFTRWFDRTNLARESTWA